MNRIHLWASEGYQIRKIELTTAAGGNAEKLQTNFKRLLRSLVRQNPHYHHLDYIGVQTTEGNGVMHMFVAAKSHRMFWIDKFWLRDEWQRIHGALCVWVKPISGAGHARVAARYVAAQYVAGQHGPHRLVQTTRYRKIAGDRVWSKFRASMGRHMGKSGIAQWRGFLGGETVNMPDNTIWQRDDVSENGPPTDRIPTGSFPGDGERWRVPPTKTPCVGC